MSNSITRRQFVAGSAVPLAGLAVGASSSGLAATTNRLTEESENYEPYQVPAGEKRFAYRNVLNNAAARVDMPIGVVHGAKEGPTLAVTAGLYATEYSGVEAASRMYRDFDPKVLNGRVIIVPVVNMPSFQFRSPMFKLVAGISPMDGKNLNDVFPGDLKGSVTEVLAHDLFHEVIVKADYHIDLRGGDLPESHVVHSIHPRVADAKVSQMCEEISRACGYEYFQSRKVNPRSLVYEAATAGVPSIITQSGLGYKEQPNEEFINLHVQAVTNVMKHLKMIEGVPTRPESQRELNPEFDRVYAGSSGVFQGIADQGDILQTGQLIGRITDLDGTVLEEIHSPIDGLVHELLVRRVVFQGDQLYNLVTFAS